jgi:uncharacterized membrane protein YhaH (DUF805 family)
MFGTLGFSYVGFIFLLCLFVPNIIYALRLPKDRKKYVENPVLLGFERIGQVACTLFVLIFNNYDPKTIDFWLGWLLLAAIALLLYLGAWFRYFQGGGKEPDFYRPLLGIPLPLATLPVFAVFMIAIYGKVLPLGIAVIILAVGHIGITYNNMNYFGSRES